MNNAYGIDLATEIDKAIKRGERDSIIEKLKNFKKDSDAHERRKTYARESIKQPPSQRQPDAN